MDGFNLKNDSTIIFRNNNISTITFRIVIIIPFGCFMCIINGIRPYSYYYHVSEKGKPKE